MPSANHHKVGHRALARMPCQSSANGRGDRGARHCGSNLRGTGSFAGTSDSAGEGGSVGAAQTPDVAAPGRTDFRLKRQRPVPIEAGRDALRAVDSSIASDSYRRAERDADDRAADHRAVDQLEAILRANEAETDVSRKQRGVRISYVQ